MKRPTRNLLLVAGFWAGCLVLGNALPEPVRAPFVVLVLLTALTSFVVARQFFVGRRHLKKKRWMDALTSFQAFERGLLESGWRRRMSWLAAGIYTSDPVCIARNNIGFIHLENGKLDLAEAAFKSALERDAGYAVPHLNLAVVAARRGQRDEMEARLAEAARLGLPSVKTHAKIRALLGAVNAELGR